MNDVICAISRHKSFLIFTHLNPDGDALGSATALALMLKKAGKKADVVIEKPLPHKYEFMNEYLCFKTFADSGEYDCAIAVDTADEARLGECRSLFLQFENTVNIDHHTTNPNFAKVNFVEGRPATGEIIFRLISDMGIELSREMAECLYIAICTDTGRFSYLGTDARTFETAAKIAETGADIPKICINVYGSKPYAAVELLAKTLNTLTLYASGKIAVLHTKMEDIIALGAEESDCEDFINYARNIDGVEIAVFMRENTAGEWKVSFRSKHYADVAALAKVFGGGGHVRASGCTSKDSFDITLKTMLEAAEKLL